MGPAAKFLGTEPHWGCMWVKGVVSNGYIKPCIFAAACFVSTIGPDPAQEEPCHLDPDMGVQLN